MSLDLGGLFRQQSNILSENSAAGKGVMQTASGKGVSYAKGVSMPVGSVVSGRVVDIKDGSLTLQTDKGQLISAKTEDGASFVKGSYLSFEVSGASENQISLKALFTNTAAGSSTMSGALLQAGISENASSFGMVKAMMENGMPIDKGSLVSMYRQVTSHPGTLSGNIVDMIKLGLPLTEENINQFEAYKNLEHQINNAVSDVSASIAEAVDELFAGGDERSALEFIKDTAKVLMGRIAETPADTEILQTDEGINGKVIISENGARGAAVDNLVKEGQAAGQTESLDNAFLKLVDGLLDQERQEISPDAEKTGGAADDPGKAFLDALNKAREGGEENSSVFKESVQNDQGSRHEGMQAEKWTTDSVPGVHLNDIAEGIEKLLADNGPEAQGRLAKAVQLLQGKELKELLSGSLSKQWRIEPDKVSSKDEVQDFYSRLRAQTQRLSETVKDALGTQNRLFEQVTNIRQNVDFMNQLNQTAAYVQLPLKLGGEDAHGDLYVYTNKKSLADSDGKVSAFLHLDMDNLGPVDVYVAMEHENVSTDFYLSDDAMIDFISENIHILNDRLADMGYDMSCKVSMKRSKEPSNVMEEMINDNRDGFLIGSKSFDVRA